MPICVHLWNDVIIAVFDDHIKLLKITDSNNKMELLVKIEDVELLSVGVFKFGEMNLLCYSSNNYLKFFNLDNNEFI